MSIFDATARIEMQDNGIRFYEQDVLPCSYLFNGNLTIDLLVDYIYPGFGIALAENNGHPFRQADRAYLLKVGYNDFQVQVKSSLAVTTAVRSSCVLAPSGEHEQIHLRIVFHDNAFSFDWITEDTAGKEKRYNLGSYRIEGELNEYRIGFYSNAGNVIRSLTFLQDVPERWTTNIHNTCGGRIRFLKDGFLMENCKNKAEIEQKEIVLDPGIYYLRYEKSLVNGMNDIECIVMPTIAASHTDTDFEDQNKNLLKDGILTIKGKPLSVNIKFKGHNGKITGIFLTDSKDSSFIETEDSPEKIDGSYITVDTQNAKEVKWQGEIQRLPDFTDLMKKCPYAILETNKHRVTKEEAAVRLNEQYAYSYLPENRTLNICTKDFAQVITTLTIPQDTGEHSINIFRNMTALIYELKVILKNGETIDMIAQKTYQKYVPEDIEGPIIVTNDSGAPLDISASYREVIKSDTTIALYTSGMPMQLRSDMPYGKMNLSVYGIPSGAEIHTDANTIEEYASSCKKIDDTQYRFEEDYFVFPETITQAYAHIAVVYRSTQDYDYWFTNWEREIYENPNGRLLFEKDAVDNDSGILVYGILSDSHISKNMIYRIPSEKMINSVDLCVDSYEIVPSDKYSVNYLNNEIIMPNDIRDQYQGFIIDYLKQDSYAINYDNTLQQYLLDISSQNAKTHIYYGSSNSYIATGIQSDKSKYIVLRRNTRTK